jgi:hypothetical protein
VSDTPRTDAKRGFHDLDTAVDAEFSEQLERELNVANDRIKRLEDAGDNLHFGWIDGYMNQRRLDEWLAAKEAKL